MLAFRSARGREALKTFAVALVLAMGIRVGIAQAYRIDGPSMEPSLVQNQHVLVLRAAYGLSLPGVDEAIATWDAPEVGDVVILESPVEPIDLVKRVVAVGGDLIAFRNGRVWRNGRPVEAKPVGGCDPDRHLRWDRTCRVYEEHVGRRRWLTSRGEARPMDRPSQRVPDGHVFVLGDHRDRSNDSRAFGAVPVERLRGRVLWVD
jgi:signal peptidase I